jgi:hypothetical protein
MKTYGRVDVKLLTFLTSEGDGGERHTSCCSCFTPWKSLQYLLYGRLGGLPTSGVVMAK